MIEAYTAGNFAAFFCNTCGKSRTFLGIHCGKSRTDTAGNPAPIVFSKRLKSQRKTAVTTAPMIYK